MSTEDAPKPTLVERMRAQREIHANRPLYLRALIVVAGFTLLLAAILSLEFAWAGRLLETALEKAEQAKQSAKQTSRFQKFVVAVAIVLAIVAAVVASILWEIPIVPYT